jgi:hypothetical protein
MKRDRIKDALDRGNEDVTAGWVIQSRRRPRTLFAASEVAR